MPIGGGIGRIFKVGHQPINANIAAYYNVVTPDDTGADWQLRAQWTFLFPDALTLDDSYLTPTCRPDVRYGSLADIGERTRDVRFTPKSGHAERQH